MAKRVGLRAPRHSVIPARRAAASPESIATYFSEQTNAGTMISGLRRALRAGSGMTAADWGKRRHPCAGTSSMRGDVTYAKNVTYARHET